MRHWPSVARGAAAALLIFLTVFVALRVAGPYLVSTKIVRNGIEQALSRWIGYEAEFEGTPQVEFWPTPRITLTDVSIRQKSGERRLFGTVERLSAEFGIIDAIRGETNFHEFHLLRPHVYLRRDENGLIDWTNEGQLSQAIGRVRERGEGRSLDPRDDAKIAAITMEDGIVDISDAGAGRVYHFTDVSADIGWWRLSSPIKAVIMAKTGGEDFKLDFSSEQPLLVFSGRMADFELSLASRLATARFAGRASITHFSGLTGAVALSVPDVQTLLAWSGASLPGTDALQSFAISGDAVSSASGIRFSDAALSVNGANATGAMEIAFGGERRPKLGGTLAFDSVNIKPLLDAFSLRLAAGEEGGPPEGGPLQRLDVDLRFSARTARLDPVELTDLGASVIVSAKEAKLDIGDSSVMGGTMTAHLEAKRGDFDGGGKLRLSMRGSDFGELVKALNLKGPLPMGKGSLDLVLQTDKPLWSAGPGDLRGTAHFQATSGTIRGLDVPAMRGKAGRSSFFRLDLAGSNDFPFERFQLDAAIADGAAAVEAGHVEGPAEAIDFSGLIPYGSSGLALSGKISALDPARAGELPDLPFFVGGSWSDPVVSTAPAP